MGSELGTPDNIGQESPWHKINRRALSCRQDLPFYSVSTSILTTLALVNSGSMMAWLMSRHGSPMLLASYGTGLLTLLILGALFSGFGFYILARICGCEEKIARNDTNAALLLKGASRFERLASSREVDRVVELVSENAVTDR